MKREVRLKGDSPLPRVQSGGTAVPADHCRVRLPEVEPSVGYSVRTGFKAPCREYCNAFSVENKIFHHGKIIVDPLL